jgi:hypothetical protein
MAAGISTESPSRSRPGLRKPQAIAERGAELDIGMHRLAPLWGVFVPAIAA